MDRNHNFPDPELSKVRAHINWNSPEVPTQIIRFWTHFMRFQTHNK